MSSLRLFSYIVGVGILFLIYSSFFTVDQTKQAIVLQFGEPKRVVNKPGLNFKIPFIQEVAFFEKRVLSLVSSDSEEVILSDQKRLEVDTYSRFKIIDPLLFYQTVRNELGARQRLESIIDSSVRRVLGKLKLISILSDARQKIVEDIGVEVNEIVKRLGMEIIDVRIRRADYPEATSQNIFNRMRSEREQEAKEFRAQGAEIAQKIRSTADKDVTVILAQANKKSEIMKGEGDGQRNKIFADAFGKDPQFFSFYRAMQSYEKALIGGDTSLILSPDSDFFKFFGKSGLIKKN